jgi:hypothetical protein
MIIFCYMLLLLLAGLAFRGYSTFEGTYVIGLAVTYFGMIGLWGYARNKRYFGQRLWQAYFVFTIATVPVLPLISPKYQEVAALHGQQAMWSAYAMSSLLALPAIWGYFAYAFRRKGLWTNARPQENA